MKRLELDVMYTALTSLRALTVPSSLAAIWLLWTSILYAEDRSWTVTLPASGRAGFLRVDGSECGIGFTNRLSSEHAAENQIRLNGSGVAAGDVDGDGWCDLYFCGLDGANALYRNLGGWKFQDITEFAGVACSNQFSTGALLVDVDGNGTLDLLVNAIGGGTRCFLNDGRGQFRENQSSGLLRAFGAMSLTMADVDGDGDLDLYVTHYRTTTIRSTGFSVLNVNGKRSIQPEDRGHLEYSAEGLILELGEPDVFYLNDGKGNFSQVRWGTPYFLDEEGRTLAEPPRDWGLSAMFRDLNGDNAPDLYVCNDFQSPDRLWINDGKGHFRLAAPTALRHTPTFSMSVDFADVNRDGFVDFFVADMLEPRHRDRLAQTVGMDPVFLRIGEIDDRPQYDHNTLQLNRGDGTFADLCYAFGIEACGWTWSSIFLDVDLDGYEDLLMTRGHLFNTQDRDANARIDRNGPYSRDRISRKILMYPPLELGKLAYRNEGGVRFKEVGKEWGFGEVGVAHGMCLVDLDNDGDLDVVVNNLNGGAGVYRNESVEPRVGVRLRGKGGNVQGIGGKIRVYGGAVAMQSQEVISGGRYLSGDDPMRVFAAGRSGREMRIEVEWRSGKRSVVEGVKANRIYEVREEGAREKEPQVAKKAGVLFEDVSGAVGHEHHEEGFDDYARQPLLPNRLSQLGPGVGWIDLDGDGREDLVIGSGKGGKVGAYRNEGGGKFTRWTTGAFGEVETRDMTGIAGYGKAVIAGSANYEDGLSSGSSVRSYEKGEEKAKELAGANEASSGPVGLCDMDGDGDLDMFVGGRVKAERYPEAASSRVYENREGKWVLDEKNSEVLKNLGLVSGAVWTDLNGDGYAELVVACEWGAIRVFENQRGRLKEATQKWGLEEAKGWWNGVTAGDFDGDGRMDLVGSNWGLNTKYRASVEYPRRMQYGDMGGGGRMDLVEAYYEQEMKKWVPERDLSTMGKVLPYVRELYGEHRKYAEAGVEEIFGERLQGTKTVEVNWLETTVWLNRGDHFERGKMAESAQWSCGYGVSVGDFDGDGKEDVVMSQNFFGVQGQTSRNDAGRGLMLRGDGKGGFEAMGGEESGIRVYGEGRGVAVGDYDGDGREDVVMAQNGAETKVYHNVGGKVGLRVRLRGGAGNPNGVGGVVRVGGEEGWGAAREVHAGSGYWSQDSTVLVMHLEETPSRIQVRWPGGKTTTSPIPKGAREISINLEGLSTVESQ